MTGQVPPIILWVNACAVVIGIFVAAIFGYLNYRLAKAKRRDDLFDRKFKFFQRFIVWVHEQNKLEHEGRSGGIDHLDLATWADEALILFGDAFAERLLNLDEPQAYYPHGALRPEILDLFVPELRLDK